MIVAFRVSTNIEFGGRQFGDAETEHRDGVAVIERDGGRHVTCLLLWVFRWTAAVQRIVRARLSGGAGVSCAA